MSLTQRELANAIHVPYQRINDLINGRRGATPSSALRLAKFFGNTPDFWMNLQLRRDLTLLSNLKPRSSKASKHTNICKHRRLGTQVKNHARRDVS
jgi:addiction module HigA family antidote